MTISKKLDRTSEEYLAITRRQKSPEGYVPYAETLIISGLNHFAFFLDAFLVPVTLADSTIFM